MNTILALPICAACPCPTDGVESKQSVDPGLERRIEKVEAHRYQTAHTTTAYTDNQQNDHRGSATVVVVSHELSKDNFAPCTLHTTWGSHYDFAEVTLVVVTLPR